ncbi:hypothetical protein LOTGIDRAFT_155606 [Lottia gigantea]|uniref:Uncharacterized protein n=1 Tax=Lottia gigantea TaxID=225164 RepID=V3ZTM6_LOTGI|nr:hypothetical protein LOTGIDRAFT_155606 [Lottia gigantea]ESO84271.1 hypothetical protein LOTGIDRAFT_155606 [Lottia gigantea]
MIPESSKVFMKLRVAPHESKHSVVYNGISANDWLCPGGISSKQKNDSSSVSIEALSKRPHTANSILVIKHNPQYRGLEKYETLTGNSYNSRSGSGSQTSDSGFVRPPTSIKRPVTAFSSRTLKRGIALATHYNIASNNSKNADLDLTIQSSHCKDVQSRKICWDVTPEVSKVDPTKETFDTIEGIRRSYQTRAQSAPACVNRTRTQTVTQDYRTKTNLYWRAKSAYHRRNMTKEDSTEDGSKYKANHQKQEQHGSLLRPLLFSSDGVIKHSAGCPYKCKGCFKACLVSQDYLNRDQEASQASWRKQRRIKRGPGFAVEFALAKSQPLYQLLHNHKNGGIKPSEDSQTKIVDDSNGTETVNKTTPNQAERNHRLGQRPMNTKPYQQPERDISKPNDPCSEKDQCKPSEKNQSNQLEEIDLSKLRQHDEDKANQQAAQTKITTQNSKPGLEQSQSINVHKPK